MKISLSNIAWDAALDADVVALLREFGVGAIEVAPTKRWDKPVEAPSDEALEYRKRWEDQGIRIVALQALLFGQPDLSVFGEARAATLDYLAGIARVGGELGAGPMVFGSPKNRKRGDTPLDEAFDLARDFFREAAERCEGTGAYFVLEPNPEVYGCDFIQTADEARAMVEAVGHPLLRLHLDAGIMKLNGEDPAKEIPPCAGPLSHFHISEPQLGVIGDGGVDHALVAQTLRGIGYEGYVSIEMRGGWTQPDTLAVRKALEVATRFYGGA